MLLLVLLLVECDESSAADGVHSALLVLRRTGTGPTCRSVDIGVNIHLLCTAGTWSRTACVAQYVVKIVGDFSRSSFAPDALQAPVVDAYSSQSRERDDEGDDHGADNELEVPLRDQHPTRTAGAGQP